MNFSDIQRALRKELEWLEHTFPVAEFPPIQLRIFDNSEYREADGALVYDLESALPRIEIHLFVDPAFSMNESDKNLLKELGTNNPLTLYYWILYHEYSHAYAMGKIKQKRGMTHLQKEMTDYEKQVDDLYQKLERKEISKRKAAFLYKKVKQERIANIFAKMIYKIKKGATIFRVGGD